MNIFLPQDTPQKVMDSIREMLEGDGLEVTAVLKSDDPDQQGVRVEAVRDYSHLPEGYAVIRTVRTDTSICGASTSGWQFGLTGNLTWRDESGDQVSTFYPKGNPFPTEREAVVAAWEHSGHVPPYVNDTKAQARAFDMATAELGWHRGLIKMRDELELNGYRFDKHPNDCWAWQLIDNTEGDARWPEFDTLESAVLSAWAFYLRVTMPEEGER